MDSSVYESFSPLSKLIRFFCLSETKKINGNYIRDPLSYYFLLINILLLISSLFLYHYAQSNDTGMESGVYLWSIRIFNWTLLVRLLCIYILRIYNYKNEISLFNTIDAFDKEISTLGKSKELTTANKVLVKFNIAAIPMSVFAYMLGEFYMIAITNNGIVWFVYCARFLGSYVGILAKFQFYLWCIALRSRFDIVNDLMLKVKDKFQLNNMFVVSVYQYEQSIEKCGDLHRDLTHMARQVNGIFQFDLLWHFAIMFVVVFTNGYYSTYMLLKNKDQLEPTSMVSNLFYIMFEVMLNVWSSTTLCNKSYKALEIFNNLKVDPDDSSTQRLVISSIFELKENRLEITACRFFKVNFSTLAVMVTIITNYIFILIQFEDANAAVPKNRERNTIHFGH